jgi:hypothetical protein
MDSENNPEVNLDDWLAIKDKYTNK